MAEPDVDKTGSDGQPPEPPPSQGADLATLRESVVGAASVSGGLWISYLAIMFYLLIAIGSVTHRDLFLESPIKLPFMNVDLPMKGFFLIGPVLFLIAHAYMLLHFAMLADRIGAFDHALVNRVADPGLRTELRRQLPADIFVQLLAGPSNVRDGLVGLFLWLIALITMVIAPVLLLLFFELQFLPYHNELITWWQRIAVGIDLVLLWLFWPSIALRRPEAALLSQPRYRRARAVQRFGTIGVMLLLTVVSPPLLLVMATFPGEALEAGYDSAWSPGWRAVPGRGWLVEGEIDETLRRPISVFSNRLVLPGLDVTGDTKQNGDDAKTTVSLRGRNLEGAILHSADLRQVDFTGARLQNANLARADLRQARFDCALRVEFDEDRNVVVFATDGRRTRYDKDGSRTLVELDGEQTPIQDDGRRHTPHADANCPQLQRARLDAARLTGVRLDFARLQGARLNAAQLQGASLNGAMLQGASLDNAQLPGASLQSAQLQFALLNNAQAAGASLDDAQLQSAALYKAELTAASLKGAALQGAGLEWTALQAAVLDDAQLNGATLWTTQLQGASLNRTQLQHVDMTTAYVWRAAASELGKSKLRSNALNTDAIRDASGPDQKAAVWSKPVFEALKRRLATTVPEGELRDAALQRIEPVLDPERGDADSDRTIAKAWSDREAAEPSADDDITLERVKVWRQIGCDPEAAPFVATEMIRWMRRETVGKNVSGPQGQAAVQRLAAEFLEPACTGAVGLSPDARAALRRIAAPR